MKSIVKFLSEVKVELSRIEWPSFQEFIGSTIIVLFLIVLFSIFLGVVDRGIAWGVKQIFLWFGA